MHPFAPVEQARGLRSRSSASSRRRCAEITGFAAVSLQPNSGAQGEFAGLLVIRAYHRDRGDAQRNVVLIPPSAHGTNPASAAMAGLKVVVVACDSDGNVDAGRSARQGASSTATTLSALMVTYPSHARRVRGRDPRDLRDRPRARRPGLHGRREHERAGRADEPGGDRRRRLPPEPAQDVRDSARRRRARAWGRSRVAKHLAPFLPGHPVVHVGGDKAIPRGVGGAVGQREHPADLVRLHPDAGRGRA